MKLLSYDNMTLILNNHILTIYKVNVTNTTVLDKRKELDYYLRKQLYSTTSKDNLQTIITRIDKELDAHYPLTYSYNIELLVPDHSNIIMFKYNTLEEAQAKLIELTEVG